MNSRLWLDELDNQLRRQGLPSSYIQRFVRELSDHFEDITEENRGMEAGTIEKSAERLGTPGLLAQAAAVEFRRHTFCQRHPVIVFGLIPVLAALGIGPILVLTAWITHFFYSPGNTLPESTVRYVLVGMTCLPLFIAAAGFCWLAARRGLSWKWSMLACLILALFAGLTFTEVKLSDLPGQSSLAIGLTSAFGKSQLIQLLVPLAVGGWSWGYRRVKMAG